MEKRTMIRLKVKGKQKFQCSECKTIYSSTTGLRNHIDNTTNCLEKKLKKEKRLKFFEDNDIIVYIKGKKKYRCPNTFCNNQIFDAATRFEDHYFGPQNCESKRKEFIDGIEYWYVGDKKYRISKNGHQNLICVQCQKYQACDGDICQQCGGERKKYYCTQCQIEKSKNPNRAVYKGLCIFHGGTSEKYYCTQCQIENNKNPNVAVEKGLCIFHGANYKKQYCKFVDEITGKQCEKLNQYKGYCSTHGESKPYTDKMRESAKKNTC